LEFWKFSAVRLERRLPPKPSDDELERRTSVFESRTV